MMNNESPETTLELESKAGRSAGVLFFNEAGDKVLLVRAGPKSRKKEGIFEPPSGRVEEGESYSEGALREFWEETGLIANEGDILSENIELGPNKILLKDGQMELFYFRVYIVTKAEGEIRGTEEAKPIWINIPDLDDYNLYMDTKDIVLRGREIFEKAKKK